MSDNMAKSCGSIHTTIICNIKSLTCTKLEKIEFAQKLPGHAQILSVVKNNVSSAHMPFIAKSGYFTEKLLVISQIFVVAVFPYVFSESRKKIVFRQVFAVDNQENT